MWYTEGVAQRNRAKKKKKCETACEIVEGDVNGGEMVRRGENDLGKMGHRDGIRRRTERDGEVDEWHMM